VNEAPSPQAIADSEHLRALRFSYQVAGGVALAYAGFGLFYVLIGAAMVPMIRNTPTQPGRPAPPELVGWIFAAISCLELPYGTALGLVTFSVLGRPSVKTMFARRGSHGSWG
jgi:hypothetical protein